MSEAIRKQLVDRIYDLITEDDEACGFIHQLMGFPETGYTRAIDNLPQPLVDEFVQMYNAAQTAIIKEIVK